MRFSLKTAIGVLTLFAILFASIAFVGRRVQQAYKSQEGYDACRRILNALQNFDANYCRLPSAARYDDFGKSLYSWRFEIQPFISAPPFPVEPGFDHPWTAPPNQSWREWSHPIYCLRPENVNDRATNFVAVVGPGTAFDDSNLVSLGGCAGSGRQLITERELIDGDTILIVEVHSSSIHWMQPGDLPLKGLEIDNEGPCRKLNVGGSSQDGFYVGFADGEIWMLRNDTPIKMLALFCTIQGAREHKRSLILKEYRAN